MKTGLLIRDAMTSEPVHCSSDWTVNKAVDLMIKKRVGSLIVKEGDFLKGILTESDLIKKVLSKGKNPNKILVSEVMTHDVVTIGPDRDVTKAMTYMAKKKVRRLPVVEKEKIVGVITMKDIIKIQPELIDLLFRRKKSVNEGLGIIGECENCQAKQVSLMGVGDRLLCKNCME